jgi:serine/threonine protein kinase
LYEAFDPVMNRPVTICLAERPTDPGVSSESQPVLFDSRQVANLDHPNIVRVLACDEDENRPYFVLERIEGQSLTAILSSNGGGLPPDQVLAMVKQAALALDHVHSKGLVHNGLTSQKVFLGSERQLKLDGFEMARPARLFDASQLAAEILSDTSRLPYVAPELLSGDPVDGRSDQFSLAAIAYEALSGHLPFQSSSPIDLLCRVMLENPEVAPGPGMPALAARVLQRGLAKSPGERFPSCDGLAIAFEAALTGRAQPEAASSASKATVLAPQVYSAPPASRSRIWLWVGLFAAASILAVGVGYFLAHQPGPTPEVPAKTELPAAAPPPVAQPAPKAKPTTASAKAIYRAPLVPAGKQTVAPKEQPPPEPEPQGIQATRPKVIQQ